MSKNQELTDFIWAVADLLRGDYKRWEYGKVMRGLNDEGTARKVT